MSKPGIFLIAATFAVTPVLAQDFAPPTEADLARANYGPYPTNLEPLVKQWAAKSLKDPDSARFGKVTKPRKEYMIQDSKPVYGYSFCADINAKNSYGGYSGMETFWFMVRNGKVARGRSTNSFAGMINIDHYMTCEDGGPDQPAKPQTKREYE